MHLKNVMISSLFTITLPLSHLFSAQESPNLFDIPHDVIILSIIPHLFTYELEEDKTIISCSYYSEEEFNTMKECGCVFEKYCVVMKSDDGTYHHFDINLREFKKYKPDFTLKHMTNDSRVGYAAWGVISSIKKVGSLKLVCKMFNQLLSQKAVSEALQIFFIHCIDDEIIKKGIVQASLLKTTHVSVHLSTTVLDAAVTKNTADEYYKIIDEKHILDTLAVMDNVDVFNLFIEYLGDHAPQALSNPKPNRGHIIHSAAWSLSFHIITTIIEAYGKRGSDILFKTEANGCTPLHQLMSSYSCRRESKKRKDHSRVCNSFKFMVKAVGSRAPELIAVQNNQGQTVLDQAYNALGRDYTISTHTWLIMLDIPEIEDALQDEAFSKEYWPVVLDIAALHAKRYAQEHGITVDTMLVALCAIKLYHQKNKSKDDDDNTELIQEFEELRI